MPDAVRAAYLGYFFGDGYLAADGTRIVLAGAAHRVGAGDPGLAARSADRAHRAGAVPTPTWCALLVESVDDVRYGGLGARVEAARAKAQGDADKLMRWFRGVSGVAESQAMSAVEQAALGVATFQSNPLIAAAAGTFAGTAARKAAQHRVPERARSLRVRAAGTATSETLSPARARPHPDGSRWRGP